jgi:hypothetical protein
MFPTSILQPCFFHILQSCNSAILQFLQFRAIRFSHARIPACPGGIVDRFDPGFVSPDGAVA